MVTFHAYVSHYQRVHRQSRPRRERMTGESVDDQAPAQLAAPGPGWEGFWAWKKSKHLSYKYTDDILDDIMDDMWMVCG